MLENKPNQPIKFRMKIWLKQMMTRVERTTLIVKLNSKPQCLSQVYLTIVMHMYLLKALYQSQNKQKQTKIMVIKK